MVLLVRVPPALPELPLNGPRLSWLGVSETSFILEDGIGATYFRKLNLCRRRCVRQLEPNSGSIKREHRRLHTRPLTSRIAPTSLSNSPAPASPRVSQRDVRSGHRGSGLGTPNAVIRPSRSIRS